MMPRMTTLIGILVVIVALSDGRTAWGPCHNVHIQEHFKMDAIQRVFHYRSQPLRRLLSIFALLSVLLFASLI